ncbi:hypothetical protein XELAEV_18038853mg [Xenopus laevis]|uniref:Uncharacterized protein n=1 Tax=Xenopus laevis TaxID=8355 RepID=A0A974C6S4_XENLA|nr:hypothetical protein XELAEV_18038853mg [Xenopus laevis]
MPYLNYVDINILRLWIILFAFVLCLNMKKRYLVAVQQPIKARLYVLLLMCIKYLSVPDNQITDTIPKWTATMFNN